MQFPHMLQLKIIPLTRLSMVTSRRSVGDRGWIGRNGFLKRRMDVIVINGVEETDDSIEILYSVSF